MITKQSVANMMKRQITAQLVRVNSRKQIHQTAAQMVRNVPPWFATFMLKEQVNCTFARYITINF